MPRPEKVQAVAEIKDRLEQARAVFLAEYAGLSVKEQQTLRRGLREGGAEFKVVKMTLARLAAAELEITDLDELFLGPTGIAFADGDPVTAAKALKEFAKDNETFIIKGGLLGREFLSPERISELAEIESREVLLAKIAGVMEAPLSNLAGLLAAMPRDMASAIQQLVDKKEEAGGGEPAAADSVEEAAGAEESSGEEEPINQADAVTAASDEVVESAEDTSESEEAEEDAAEPAPEDSADADEDNADADEDKEDEGDNAKSVDEDPAEEAEEE